MKNADRRQMNRRRIIQKHKRRIRMNLIRFFFIICVAVVVFAVFRKLNGRESESLKLSGGFRSEHAGGNNADDMDNKDESDAGEKNDEEEWSMILVNKWNPLPEGSRDIETVELSNGERVDKRIYPRLQSMFDDARADGIYPVVASGYRTKERQEELYNSKIAAYEAEGLSSNEAKKEAELWVAVPGTSEHELGLAVDINADKIHSSGDQVYQWLSENAYKYGFIYRYPSDKTEITGVSNEPWHYRYVGKKAAAEIYEQGICLEEYLK